MDKEQLLEQLQHDVYCRLMPSPIAGVGVFAIKKIPKGTKPFKGCFTGHWTPITPDDLKKLKPEIQKYVKDMCALQNGKYYLPSCGIPRIDISFFINHSTTPNMREIGEGDDFITLCDIKPGDELTVDYSTYNDFNQITRKELALNDFESPKIRNKK